MKADVVIIGAGAVGSSIARELSRYKLKVVLLEKSEDIGGNASKSNSAMIICGYDTPPGSLENKLILASNAMMDRLAKELDVKFKRIGALQIAKTEDELPALNQSYEQALANGVYDVTLHSAAEICAMEPNVSKNIAGGMLVPRESIVDVFELMVAYVENAVANGVTFMRSTEVLRVEKDDKGITAVVTNRGRIETNFVVNAAGLFGDKIAKSLGVNDFRSYPRKGQFYILDKNLPYMPNHMLMPIPTPLTRGKLVVPTVHDNLLLGPTAMNIDDRYDKATIKEDLDSIIREVRELIPAIDPRDSVTQFAGLRPARDPGGYHIRTIPGIKGYIEALGILTGISGSPAIGVHVTHMLADEGLRLERKPDFNPYRVSIPRFNKMSAKEKAEIIKENPSYGKVICRCETVTEGEIVAAIHRNPGARSVDGVKRRLRAGMGRCQGGFCGPRIVDILARELGVSPTEITKNEKGSEMLACINRTDDLK